MGIEWNTAEQAASKGKIVKLVECKILDTNGQTCSATFKKAQRAKMTFGDGTVLNLRMHEYNKLMRDK